MITIQNKGQAIVDTNYWGSEMAASGLMFLSWNAGAARLLIPDTMKSVIREMRTGKNVIISRGHLQNGDGREVLELLFEDYSDSPFSVQLSVEQCDRLLPESECGAKFNMSVWTSGGMKMMVPGRYRVVKDIPCLQAWNSN